MTLKVIEKGFKAYQRYLAIKAHFTTDSYDILKHKGKVRASVSSFKTRNDRYYFARVEKKYSKKVRHPIVQCLHELRGQKGVR